MAPSFYAVTPDPINVPAQQYKFYKIVHNNLAVKISKNSVTVNEFNDLLEDKEKFSSVNAIGDVEYHTATMIHIIYENTDLMTAVGMGSILKELENSKIADFTNNANLLCKMMEKTFNVLKDNGEETKNYLLRP